jgi:hypothetical protein
MRRRVLKRRYGHAAKWVQRIKDNLAKNPLLYTKGRTNTSTEHLKARLAQLEGYENIPCVCERCAKEKGIATSKKVPLYAVTNYGNEFNHCYVCGVRYA